MAAKRTFSSYIGSASVGGYYRVTFRAFYGLAMVLAVYSKVASIPIIAMSAFLGIAALTRITVPLSRSPVLRHIFYTIVPLLMCVSGFYSYFSHKDWFMAIAEALCGVVPFFVYDHTRPRGYWLSVLTMVILGLGALLLSERVESYAIFVVMLMVAVFNLNAAKLYFLAKDKRELGEGLPPKYFYLLLRTFPAAVLVTSVIFVVFPRMKALAISFGASKNGNQVGYTDSISLSGGGILNETSTVAFWVESENRDWLSTEGPHLLFRGNSLEIFDGKNWESAKTSTKPLREISDLRTSTAHSIESVSLKIYREPSSAKAFFVPLVLRELSPQALIVDQMTVDLNRNIVYQRSDPGRYTYEMSVSPFQMPKYVDQITVAAVKEAMSIAPGQRDIYFFPGIQEQVRDIVTEVPSKIKNAEWFAAWVAGVGSANASLSVLQILQQLGRHFRSEFGVSLENEFDSNNALKEFLTVKKKGHCEYFVSASVLYLRTMGIPARAVAGYRGGVFNAVTQLLEVQEQNAHAWVELWLPDVGWITFDPTPFVAVSTPGGLMADFKHYVSAVNFWFYRYIVDFNPETQRELAENVVAIDFRKLFKISDFTFDDSIKELSVLGFAMLVMFWVLVRVIKRRRETQDLPRFYSALAMKVRKYGYTRSPGESFRLFHQRLIDVGFAPSLIKSFDQTLEAAIYADRPVSKEEVRALVKSLRRLRRPAIGG